MIKAVDLAVIDPVESLLLRGILEYEGVRVNWFPIGRPSHLVDVLAGVESRAPHLVICCHGDDRGIILEELHPDFAGGEPFLDRLTPELARQYVHLDGRVVVATGCGTGSPAMARSFLDGGCQAYIGPDGDPDRSLLFLHRFYHELVNGAELEAAVEHARGQDQSTLLFTLYRR